MRAGAFAADGERFAAEIADVVADPKRRRFAIIRAGRVGVLRRQAIFDADRGQPSIVGDDFKQAILLIRRAKHVAAAVQM